MRKIINLLIIAGVIILIYKLGEKKGKKIEKVNDNECEEETYITQLIDELKLKKNKTNKDKDNLGLLEIKLQQIRDKR